MTSYEHKSGEVGGDRSVVGKLHIAFTGRMRERASIRCVGYLLIGCCCNLQFGEKVNFRCSVCDWRMHMGRSVCKRANSDSFSGGMVVRGQALIEVHLVS